MFCLLLRTNIKGLKYFYIRFYIRLNWSKILSFKRTFLIFACRKIFELVKIYVYGKFLQLKKSSLIVKMFLNTENCHDCEKWWKIVENFLHCVKFICLLQISLTVGKFRWLRIISLIVKHFLACKKFP